MRRDDFDPVRGRRSQGPLGATRFGNGLLLAALFLWTVLFPTEKGANAAGIERLQSEENRPGALLIVDEDPLPEDEGLGGEIDPDLENEPFTGPEFEEPIEPGIEDPLNNDEFTDPGFEEPFDNDRGGFDPGTEDEFTDPGFEEPLDPGLEDPFEPGLEEPGLNDDPFIDPGLDEPLDDRGGIDPGLEEDEFGDPLEPGIDDPLAPGFDPGMNDDHLAEPGEAPLEPGVEDPGL